MAQVPGAERVEPDLTAMLDVVMQMLMYFIMNLNTFIMENAPPGVELPVSQSARPLDKGEKDVLFLNITRDGKVLTMDQPTRAKTLDETREWLKKRYSESDSAGRKDKDGHVSTAIIIRADKDTSYGFVHDVLKACKHPLKDPTTGKGPEEGFSDVRVRGLKKQRA
jgi:biopolymer transport protein ExbD